MPIYMIIDGVILNGSTAFGLPLNTFAERFDSVPQAFAQFAPLEVSFPFVAEMPSLMRKGDLDLSSNVTFNFTAPNATGAEMPYMTITLTNAFVSHLEFTGGPTGLPFITLLFVWENMNVHTFGLGGTNYTFTYHGGITSG